MERYDDKVLPAAIKRKLDDTEFSPSKMEQIEEYSLSDSDVRHYLPNCSIISYPDLKNYSSIDELLPQNKSFFILLFLETENSGHWTAVMKINNTIEFFCSYGSSPITPLRWNKDANEALGIHAPYLNQLLDKSPLPVYYNPIDYQDMKDLDIATCGRHCCSRIICMRDYDMNLNQYYDMMRQAKAEEKQTYDQIVSELYPKC
jgi:hypothetical protein